MTGRAAAATQCPSCGTYISLRNHVISGRVSAPVSTRGNVVVGKRGALITSKIQCHDLVIYGKVAGKINCSGTVRFRATGKVLGEIRSEKFVVEKRSKLQFLHPVHATTVEIHAPTAVDIVCDGPVWIGSKGSVSGGVLARSLKIEDGGALDGTLSILAGALDAEKEDRELEKIEEFEARKRTTRRKMPKNGRIKAPAGNAAGNGADAVVGNGRRKGEGKRVGSAAAAA